MPEPLYEQTYHSDGTMTETVVAEDASLLEKEVASRVAEALGEARVTEAQERLLRLRGSRLAAPPVQKHPINGEDWFTRQANFEGINRIALLTPRDAQGAIVMAADGALTSLLTAMMFVCCVTGEVNPRPFFENWQDAFNFVTDPEPGVVDTCNQLFAIILRQSPDIWPQGKEQLDKLEAEQERDAPLATESSTSPLETPEGGLSETELTASPVE